MSLTDYLKGAFLGTVLSAGMACAAVPKVNCMLYPAKVDCEGNYNNAVVWYSRELTVEGILICGLQVFPKNNEHPFALMDFECDSMTDAYIGIDKSGVVIKPRDFNNPEHDAFFERYDILLKDKVFEDMKKFMDENKK